MPRDGSGNYTAPFPDVVTATPVASTVYNGFVHDIATDLNAARPIVAGGTGGNSAAAARAALTVETYGQIVTNYDSMSFQPGSFFSDAAATSPPVVGHAFVGLCAFVDGNNMYLEAYDRDDAAQPGALWVRQKKAGVWSSWAKSQALNIVGTPAANAFTTWQSSTALQAVAITGLVKGNGASAPAAAAAGTDYAPPTSGSAILKGNGSGGFSNAVANTDYLPVASPTMTGVPIAPTAAANTNNTQIATTAYADVALALKAPLNSPGLTGNPTAPTQAPGDNSTKIATTAYADAAVAAVVLRDYLAGLTLSTVGSSTSFGVAAGMAVDSTNVNLMSLASAITKTTGAWAVGSGNGGLDTGAIAANTWYHAYEIKRPDTNVVDVCVSLSASAPTTGGAIPAAYTRFRRIGAMKTNASSQWVKFWQNNDTFLLSEFPAAADYQANNPGNAAVTVTLNTPPGVRTEAILNLGTSGVSTGFTWWLSSLDVSDLFAATPGPGPFTPPGGQAGTNVSATLNINYSARVWTNASAQIRSRINNSSANTAVTIAAIGWVDRRGKDD